MHAASMSAPGLAMPLPAMSGAVPCTASKIAAVAPMFAPGASPSPPTSPEMRSERMSPNRFVVTMTSKRSGLQHELHRHRVDDALLELDAARVLARDLAADVEEESLRVLEDVRLVDERDLLAPVLHARTRTRSG